MEWDANCFLLKRRSALQGRGVHLSKYGNCLLFIPPNEHVSHFIIKEQFFQEIYGKQHINHELNALHSSCLFCCFQFFLPLPQLFIRFNGKNASFHCVIQLQQQVFWNATNKSQWSSFNPKQKLIGLPPYAGSSKIINEIIKNHIKIIIRPSVWHFSKECDISFF